MSKLENLMFNNSDDIPDAWIIEKIKEKEERKRQPIQPHIPLPDTMPYWPEKPREEEKPKHGVVIVDVNSNYL